MGIWTGRAVYGRITKTKPRAEEGGFDRLDRASDPARKGRHIQGSLAAPNRNPLDPLNVESYGQCWYPCPWCQKRYERQTCHPLSRVIPGGGKHVDTKKA